MELCKRHTQHLGHQKLSIAGGSIYMAHPIFAPEPTVGFVEKITK